MVGQLHKTVSLRSVADSSVYPQARLSLCPTLRLQPCSVLQLHLSKCTLGTNSHIALVTACSVFRSYSSKRHLKLLGLRSSKEKQLVRTQEQKHPKQTQVCTTIWVRFFGVLSSAMQPERVEKKLLLSEQDARGLKPASVSSKNLGAADSRNFVMEKQQQWKTTATIPLATLNTDHQENSRRQASEWEHMLIHNTPLAAVPSFCVPQVNCRPKAGYWYNQHHLPLRLHSDRKILWETYISLHQLGENPALSKSHPVLQTGN